MDLFYDHHFNFLMTYPLVHGILTGHDFPTHKSGWNRMKMKYRQHPLDLGHPISKEAPPPLQMITNQLKRNIILGWLLYVLRSFLQVGFRFHYQLINLAWLSIDLSSFSWSQSRPQSNLKILKLSFLRSSYSDKTRWPQGEAETSLSTFLWLYILNVHLPKTNTTCFLKKKFFSAYFAFNFFCLPNLKT